MKRDGLALLLLSGAWGFVDRLYAPRDTVLAAVFLSLGIGLLLVPPRRPIPIDAGHRYRLRRTAATAAAVLLAQSLLWPLLAAWASHWGELPGLSSPLATVIRFLGGEATAADGRVFVERAGRVLALQVQVDHFAPAFLLRFLIGAAVLAWTDAGRRAGFRPDRLLIATAVYAAARLMAVLLIALEVESPYLLVEPMWTLVTHLPLACVPTGTGGRSDPAADRPVSPPRCPRAFRREAGAATLAALGGGILAIAVGFTDPGIRGGGRVLIDESHGRWEGTADRFDAERYGRASLYNYRCWRDWLDLHYDVEARRRFPTPAELETFDVLVIKTPSRPYADGDIETIREFVRRGGGLLLIGDHTNLFGMGTVLNGVARPFGIRFRFDDLYPLRHGGRDVFRPAPLLRHPVVARLDAFPLETSCSLEIPMLARHVMVGTSLGRDPADYSHPNFFGDLRLNLDEDFGTFTQMAAVESGRGRVLAFAKSKWEVRNPLSLCQL